MQKIPKLPLFSSGLKNFVKTPMYEIRDLPPPPGCNGAACMCCACTVHTCGVAPYTTQMLSASWGFVVDWKIWDILIHFHPFLRFVRRFWGKDVIVTASRIATRTMKSLARMQFVGAPRSNNNGGIQDRSIPHQHPSPSFVCARVTNPGQGDFPSHMQLAVAGASAPCFSIGGTWTSARVAYLLLEGFCFVADGRGPLSCTQCAQCRPLQSFGGPPVTSKVSCGVCFMWMLPPLLALTARFPTA